MKNYRVTDSSKMRAKLWFSVVSSRENLTAYSLDHLFNQYSGRIKDDRVRVFEAAKAGKLPSDGSHAKRKFNLIEIVEADKKYQGTKKIFDSIFWKFAEDRTRRLNMYDFRELAAECIKAAILEGISSKKTGPLSELSIKDAPSYDSKVQKKYHLEVPEFLNARPVSLEQLAAVGVLYREAYLSCSHFYAAELHEHYLILLREFVKNKWIDNSLKEDFFNLAVKILCPIVQNNRRRMPSILEKILKDKHAIIKTKDKNFLAKHHVSANFGIYDPSAYKNITNKQKMKI